MSSKAPYGTPGPPTKKVMSELEAAAAKDLSARINKTLSAHIDKTLLEAAMPISIAGKDFWRDPVIESRMLHDAKMANYHTADALRMAQTTGTGISMQANVPKNPSKSFAVKPIKNGYLVLANSEEFYCADLAAVGAQVVAIMAAHMME